MLTWNACFEPPFLEERLRWLVALVRDADADVVALQELRPDTYAVVREAVRGTHEASPPPSPLTAYFTATFVDTRRVANVAFERVAFEETEMGRDLLLATVQSRGDLGQGVRFVVGNVHLESLSSQATRRRQMAQVVRESAASGASDVLVVGDFNMDDVTNYPHLGPPRKGDRLGNLDVIETLGAAGFVDVWPKLNPTDAGKTYDSATLRWKGAPPMARPMRARYDRVMASLRSGLVSLRSARLVGDMPVRRVSGQTGSFDLYPSDHFGILVELEAPSSLLKESALAVESTPPPRGRGAVGPSSTTTSDAASFVREAKRHAHEAAFSTPKAAGQPPRAAPAAAKVVVTLDESESDSGEENKNKDEDEQLQRALQMSLDQR